MYGFCKTVKIMKKTFVKIAREQKFEDYKILVK